MLKLILSITHVTGYYISVYLLWVQRMFNVFVPTFIFITITIFTNNSVAFISLERSLWGHFFYL